MLNSNLNKAKYYKIDPEHIIAQQSGKDLQVKHTYTATEKCFIEYSTYGGDYPGAGVLINGITYNFSYTPNYNIIVSCSGVTPMLENGDVFEISALAHGWDFTVYGVKEYSE